MKSKNFDRISAFLCVAAFAAGTCLALESAEKEPIRTAPEVIMREPPVIVTEQEILPSYDTKTPEPPEEVSIYLGEFKVTGYVPNCEHCCGKTDGIMANGEKCIVGTHCATNKDFEFGSELNIDGLGAFVVGDRGVGDGVIDIACDTHEECYALTGLYHVYGRM